jgi:hypothetical protein
MEVTLFYVEMVFDHPVLMVGFASILVILSILIKNLLPDGPAYERFVLLVNVFAWIGSIFIALYMFAGVFFSLGYLSASL